MKRTNFKPVVAIDIDGTLGDYHGHFLRFAADWTGKPMPDPSEINPGLPLFRHMHISKATYRACKLAFRQGGLKRSMPCYPGASELTRAIRKAGAEVWICTTRPYLRLDNIDPDTRHWLRRNKIQHDAVIYGEQKYKDLVRNVGIGRVVCVLDDLPEMYTAAELAGIKRPRLRDQPYNRHFSGLRVHDLNQAKLLIIGDIRRWQERHKHHIVTERMTWEVDDKMRCPCGSGKKYGECKNG